MTLAFEAVSHSYGDKSAVADFSLTVGTGEVVCLVGPSGCGKSSVLRLAAGLEALQRGRILIDGEAAAENQGVNLPPEARRIGLVFQDYALFPHLSVIENVCFGLGRRSGAEDRRRATALLDRLGLAGYAERYPHALSGGEQQRVALARALAPNPRIMLLDEPFSGLDIQLRDRVRDEALALLKEAGSPVLLVTHDPQEAMRMADRVAVMREGSLVQVASPATIYGRPFNAFVAAFFGAVNRFAGAVTGGTVETPIGRFVCPPGTASAEVVVRCSGVTVLPATAAIAAGVQAQVVVSKSVGPFSVVDAQVIGSEASVRAQIPGNTPPAPGEHVQLSTDPAQTFIFPQ